MTASIEERVAKAKRKVIEQSDAHQWWGGFHIFDWTVKALRASGLRIVPEEPTERVRHRKRGSTYEVLMLGIQEHDMEPVIIYRCEQDGRVWVRPRSEFNDGRFEWLPKPEVKPDHGYVRVPREKLEQILVKVEEYAEGYRNCALGAYEACFDVRRIVRAMLAVIDKEDGE